MLRKHNRSVVETLTAVAVDTDVTAANHSAKMVAPYTLVADLANTASVTVTLPDGSQEAIPPGGNLQVWIGKVDGLKVRAATVPQKLNIEAVLIAA